MLAVYMNAAHWQFCHFLWLLILTLSEVTHQIFGGIFGALLKSLHTFQHAFEMWEQKKWHFANVKHCCEKALKYSAGIPWHTSALCPHNSPYAVLTRRVYGNTDTFQHWYASIFDRVVSYLTRLQTKEAVKSVQMTCATKGHSRYMEYFSEISLQREDSVSNNTPASQV